MNIFLINDFNLKHRLVIGKFYVKYRFSRNSLETKYFFLIMFTKHN